MPSSKAAFRRSREQGSDTPLWGQRSFGVSVKITSISDTYPIHAVCHSFAPYSSVMKSGYPYPILDTEEIDFRADGGLEKVVEGIVRQVFWAKELFTRPRRRSVTRLAFPLSPSLA